MKETDTFFTRVPQAEYIIQKITLCVSASGVPKCWKFTSCNKLVIADQAVGM